MENEKRMAGDYEITNSFHIGDREIVIGENFADAGHPYMVAYCDRNELFAKYYDVMTSVDYTEIVKLYGERICSQAELVLKSNKELDLPATVISKDDCVPDDYRKSINGKVIAIALSMLVGIWHFFVPYMFQWYSYIPNEYGNLIVGIDWTNFFFSLLLTGISLLLILFCNKVFNGNGELFVFYGFLIFVWFCRVIITFIEPWPLEPIAWAAYGQQIAAFVIFIVQLIPFIYLLKQRKFTNKAK